MEVKSWRMKLKQGHLEARLKNVNRYNELCARAAQFA